MIRALRMPGLAVLALALPVPVVAQPIDLPLAPADGSPLPPDVTVRESDNPAVYTDRKDRVLYGMDMRTVLRWSPDAAQYCTGACRRTWEPLLAPKGSIPNNRFPVDGSPRNAPGFVSPQTAPDWTIIAGPDGAQWVFKGWHMVYVRRGADSRSPPAATPKATVFCTPPIPRDSRLRSSRQPRLRQDSDESPANFGLPLQAGLVGDRAQPIRDTSLYDARSTRRAAAAPPEQH